MNSCQSADEKKLWGGLWVLKNDPFNRWPQIGCTMSSIHLFGIMFAAIFVVTYFLEPISLPSWSYFPARCCSLATCLWAPSAGAKEAAELACNINKIKTITLNRKLFLCFCARKFKWLIYCSEISNMAFIRHILNEWFYQIHFKIFFRQPGSMWLSLLST